MAMIKPFKFPMIDMETYSLFCIMKNLFIKNKYKNENIETANKYLIKYIQDIKLHFDLNDDEIKKLVMRSYCAVKPENPVIKCLSMIKLWGE